jgi:hypothetical protein
MALISDKHIRHLPAFENGKLFGLLSVRNVLLRLSLRKSFLAPGVSGVCCPGRRCNANLPQEWSGQSRRFDINFFY